MEKRIKTYEAFIKSTIKTPLTPEERQNLAAYHKEMLLFFQHERLVHLIIMLFFVTITFALLAILIWSVFVLGFKLELICLYILTAITTILSIAYVRHYFFLENHIQSLYDYTSKIHFPNPTSPKSKQP